MSLKFYSVFLTDPGEHYEVYHVWARDHRHAAYIVATAYEWTTADEMDEVWLNVVAYPSGPVPDEPGIVETMIDGLEVVFEGEDLFPTPILPSIPAEEVE